MSDVGWCLACRSILYTPLQIAESDFRRSEFKTMVFPVRDVVWLQERVRLRDAEIKAMDTVNDEMGATILSLRADLAEARADVQRFEAALDVSQRALAEARKDIATLARSYLKPYARALKQDPDDGGYSATIIEFAGCYSEGETRDEALANIEEAATGWMLAALSMGQTIPEPMKYRRTILALVVFGRAAWRSLRTLAGNQARWQMAQLGVKVNMLLVSERSKTSHV